MATHRDDVPPDPELSPEQLEHLAAVQQDLAAGAQRLGRRAAGCLFWPVALMALFFAWAGAHEVIMWWETRSLTETTAEVIAAEVGDVQRWSSADGSDTAYLVDIRYRYVVDGASHEGEGTLPPSGFYDTEAEAAARAEEVRRASTVNVLYRSSAPATSYLHRPEPGNGWVGLIMGAVFLVAARRLRRHARSASQESDGR